MARFTPQVGPYDCSKADTPPQLYWSSPSGRTASIPVSRLAVDAATQSPPKPSPLLNPAAVGSQAMSPAEPMTGSGFGCTCTVVVLTGSVLPALSTEKYLTVMFELIVNGWLFHVGLEVVGVDPSVV